MHRLGVSAIQACEYMSYGFTVAGHSDRTFETFLRDMNSKMLTAWNSHQDQTGRETSSTKNQSNLRSPGLIYHTGRD